MGPREAGNLSLLHSSAGGVGTSTYRPVSAVIVGRSSSADLILDDVTVSRRHAEFFTDRHGEWRVRDLGSFNGISVNGTPVRDHPIHDGDLVHIGDVPLTVRLGARTAERTADIGAPLDIRVGQNVSIARLRSPDQPKLDASQLFTVQRMVKCLLDEPDPHRRLVLLCRQMLGPPLGGRHAAVVQVPRSGPGHATLVAGPETVSSRGKESFYLSRSVVDALRASAEPVLASNSPTRATSAAPMTIVSGDDYFAVAACPLADGSAESGQLRVLYVVLPALLGSLEWLALAALVAAQYEHAEVAWRGRLAAAEQAAIDRDLRQARRIQLALIPNHVDLPGLDVAISFRPCRTVGGDYVDAFELPDGRSLLVVADVAGKGMQAALIASSLHTWLHATVASSGDLTDSVTQLNRYLHRTLPDGSFATLVAAVIDPNTGGLEYINAGHPPILIGSIRGSARELRTGSNLPLGVLDTDMKPDADRIDPGECLLLYTDGLTESLRPDGAWLGVEGVARLLVHTVAGGGPRPLDALVGSLINLLESQTTGYDADDRTILLAARR